MHWRDSRTAWSSVESPKPYCLWPSSYQQPDGHYNKLVEQKILSMHVRKLLYSVCFFTEQEFWSLYDKKTYSALKKKFDSNGKLPGLYEKCTRK